LEEAIANSSRNKENSTSASGQKRKAVEINDENAPVKKSKTENPPRPSDSAEESEEAEDEEDDDGWSVEE